MPDPLLIGGSVITAAAALQAGWLAFESVRRAAYVRVRRAREMELLEWKIAAARKQQAALNDVNAWTGWRKFVVSRKVREGDDICSFYLTPHDRQRLPTFRPGQFLTFQLPVPGRPKPIVRCYSLSDILRDNSYRVTIKRVPAPPERPDAPAGLGSSYFHDHVKEGDILDVRAAAGKFCLDPDAPGPLVLVAGGIGVTPLLGMLHGIVNEGAPLHDTHLFLGVRHGGVHAFRDELAEIARRHPKLHLHVYYSEPLPGDVQGRDYHDTGHADIACIRRTLPSSNFRFYICGPPPMMASLVPALVEWGVASSHIHYEAFGPASVTRVASATSTPVAPAAPTEVVFEKSRRTIQWTPEQGTLLDCAAAHGIALDAGCRAGNCGTCAVAVREGTVTYRTKPGVTAETGTCLTCCSIPESRLVLDA